MDCKKGRPGEPGICPDQYPGYILVYNFLNMILQSLTRINRNQ